MICPLKLTTICGKDFIKLLEKLGFVIIRINDSHHRLKHEDGRMTTIPVHGTDDLPKGLLRKIIREDLQLSLDEFTEIYEKNK
jgi:predicted RNA binding protein YcfA (HicA-like mRNA interferase family)